MKANKILVTGSNGQLGRSLQEIQSRYSGFDFTFLSKQDLDISDAGQVKELFGQIQPDYVINCAAYTNVDGAESDKEMAYEINASGAQHIAESLATLGGSLIHISSDYVYHSITNRAITEDDITTPVGVYARSKLAGEKLIKSSGCRHFIIRTSWVYSPYGKNFVKTMLSLAKNKSEISVVDDQTGSPTYALDLASAIMTIIEKDYHKSFITDQIYNFSNKGTTTFYGFANAIFLLSNIKVNLKPITTQEFKTPADRPSWSVLSKHKITSEVDIELKAWQKSLMECLEKLKYEIG